MRGSETVLVAIITMDVEPVDSVHALQFFEAVEWHFTGSSDELEQFGTLFLVEGTHCTPEPLNLGRGRRVIVILSVGFPVVHIDLGQTGNQQLKFLLGENGNQLRWDNFMEA